MNFTEIWSRIKPIVERNSIFLPLIVALLPFVIAALMTMGATRGDVQLANYIMQETGIVNIWSQGLVLMVYVILAYLLTIGMGYGLIRINQGYWALLFIFCFTLECLIMPLQALLIVVVLSIALFIYRQWIRPHMKVKPKKKDSNSPDKTWFTLYLFVLALILAVQAYPYVSTTIYSMKDGSNVKARQISQDDSSFLVMTNDDKKVELIQKSNVTSKQVCRTSPSSATDFLNRSLYDNLAGDKKLMSSC